MPLRYSHLQNADKQLTNAISDFRDTKVAGQKALRLIANDESLRVSRWLDHVMHTLAQDVLVSF